MAVFAEFRAEAYPHKFEGRLLVPTIAGGTPTDKKVAEGWLRSKLGTDKEEVIQEMAIKAMIERGVDPNSEEAAAEININRHLNGFKKDEDGLFIEGRQLKACLKEAANIAVAADKLKGKGWGKTNKGLLSFFSEHMFVVEDRLHLGVKEAHRIDQRFVHTWRGSGIQYEEIVEDAEVNFTVISDYNFSDKEWATIWLIAENQGLGASRSQGYGRFEVVGWDRVK